MITLQSYGLDTFSGMIGNGIVQAFGGSALFIGIAVLLAIGLFCWRYNIHITVAMFMSTIALTFLKEYFNQAGSNDIGIFGTMYNIMLLGMAIVFVLFISELRK